MDQADSEPGAASERSSFLREECAFLSGFGLCAVLFMAASEHYGHALAVLVFTMPSFLFWFVDRSGGPKSAGDA